MMHAELFMGEVSRCKLLSKVRNERKRHGELERAERECKYMQLCQNMCKILTILNWRGETCMIQYEP